MSSIKVNDDDDNDDNEVDDKDESLHHQVKDLYVVVNDPEKHVGGYVSYNVNTKVVLNLFDNHGSYCYFTVAAHF